MPLVALALAPALPAQQTPKVALNTSESLFSVLAAINACGYDQELGASDPLRARLRIEVANAVAASPEAAATQREMCAFYSEHHTDDPGHDLAQYVSLGLYLGEPPALEPTLKEADLPPDASYVLGIVPLLQRYYQQAGLHRIFEKHRADFDAETESVSPPIARMIQLIDAYVRMPIAGYVGRRLVIELQPLGAPGQVNARSYGSDYYLVLSPAGGAINLEQVRHTYLHFILDPLAMKRGKSLRRLEPLLLAVKTAPMDESFKNDIVLMVNESLIRALEARQIDPGKHEGERTRRAAVELAEKQGFILTSYFYDALEKFEKDKDSVGLQDAYPDMLYDISVDREKKHAENVEFASQAPPEVVRASQPRQASPLDLAEARLVSGDLAAAQRLAQQGLEQHEDPARAFFILARVATLNGDMKGALNYFQRTLEVGRDPRMVAWAHIYLGRIYDLQAEREQALEHYRAALAAGDVTPDTKAAAERGLAQPYAPPAPRR